MADPIQMPVNGATSVASASLREASLEAFSLPSFVQGCASYLPAGYGLGRLLDGGKGRTPVGESREEKRVRC